MGQQINVQRGQQVPLTLSVSQNGGVAGLTCDVRVRDTDTGLVLDWSDLTFKAAAWTTERQSLTDLGGGVYQTVLDLSAITNLPLTTVYLTAEFRSFGAVQGIDVDTITIEEDVLEQDVDTGVSTRVALRNVQSMAAGRIVRTGNQYAYRDSADASTLYTNEDNDNERTPI